MAALLRIVPTAISSVKSSRILTEPLLPIGKELGLYRDKGQAIAAVCSTTEPKPRVVIGEQYFTSGTS
jgi:hypothetical protein